MIASEENGSTHDKNVDLPISASPSNKTVTSGVNTSEAMLETDATRASGNSRRLHDCRVERLGCALSKGDDGAYR